jgi:hypothetical protein
MLIAVRKLRLGFLMAALAGVMTAASAGPAVAAKIVTSDTVTFKGTVNSAGEYSASACSLKSDKETTAVPCQVRGRALGIGSPAIEVTSFWASSDGEGFFPPFTAPRTVSKPPIETYQGTGPCEEHEESDLPGTKGPVTYPCQVTVKLTFNTKKGTVAGNYTVREESTQP